MRVLLTGAGGFAGSHFLDHALRTTNWDVICTDSFRHKGKLDRIDEVRYGLANPCTDWPGRTEVITHDLTVPFSNQSVDKIGDIDWMICYASESHVTRSINDPVSFIQNNVNVALSTLELARKLKPKGVVWISTDEVCGPLTEGQEPHPEWSLQLSSNPYSASKAAQENIAFAYWRTFGVPVVIVRCMNMFGERQDPEKFIPLVMQKVLNGEEIAIHADAEGNAGTRNYLHARNLADGIKFVIENIRPAQFGDKRCAGSGKSVVVSPAYDRPDMYNVVAGAVISNLKLAELIAGEMDRRLHYRLEDASVSRPGHDPHYGLSPSKLYGLGWTPPIDFEASLRKTIRWTMANRRWLLED